MSSKLLWMMVAAITLAGCAPYRMEDQHLVFENVPGLTVHERSEPKRPQASDMRHAKFGLPVLSTLERESYTLTFQTPAHSSYPMLFVGARTPSGETLRIEGPHLKDVHPDARVTHADHPYTFMTREAKGDSVVFVVCDGSGKELGRENLAYEIVVTDVIWGVDSV
jgi:hypothetical protein